VHPSLDRVADLTRGSADEAVRQVGEPVGQQGVDDMQVAATLGYRLRFEVFLPGEPDRVVVASIDSERSSLSGSAKLPPRVPDAGRHLNRELAGSP
jgi:hypothetical protein